MTTAANNTEDEAMEIESKGFIRQWLVRLLWLTLISGLAITGYHQLTRTDVLPIEKIKVSGEFDQLKRHDFQQIIESEIEGNFFTVNVTDVYSSLIALPWVEKVWIHRIWPNTIKIDLKEQKPIAILKKQGLINVDGEIFTQDSSSFEDELPLFVVAKQYTQAAVHQYQKNLAILSKNNLKTQVFYYDERKSQTILLVNGIELIVGNIDTEQRLKKFAQAYKNYLQYDKRKIKKVDLRYTNGLAVSWGQAATKSQHTKKQLT